MTPSLDSEALSQVVWSEPVRHTSSLIMRHWLILAGCLVASPLRTRVEHFDLKAPMDKYRVCYYVHW